MFRSESPVKISIGKGIVRIYKYEQRKWPYLSTNNTIRIRPHFDTSIQTQFNSDSDASEGSNYMVSSGLYQSTNHHINTDGKDNDHSQ